MEIVVSGGIVAPKQYGPTCGKDGGIFGVISILIVEVDAHSPAEGVKVLVVVEVLFIAGAQVPEIPFEEFVDNGDIIAPEQKGPTSVKVGEI